MRPLCIVVGITVLCSSVSFTGRADDSIPKNLTFTRDVAPIMAANCMRCHRPGEPAPMSLTSYDEARPWAKSILKMVESRQMPPWFADPEFGHFSNDASLTDVEVATIVRWVEQGAKRGNLKDMPEIPEFSSGWQLGEPDFIVELPEVTIPATGNDYFPDLSFNADFPEDEWVGAIEIRPSNRDVAHHVVIFMNGGGGGAMSGQFNVLGVWALGTEPNVFPKGMGRRLKSGQRLMANMHYHPNGVSEEKDTTRIGLYFGEGELEQEVVATITGQFAFNIPAGSPNHLEESTWFTDQDIRIVSFFPHMHMRGKDMSFTAVYPDGNRKTLLSVPRYDFDWQLFYYPDAPVTLPAGSHIDITAHYDNSADNPNNPDPTRDVGFGLQSTDEMMFGVFEYVVDGNIEQTKVLTAEEKFARKLEHLPQEDTYNLDMSLLGNEVLAALLLPREGEGKWHITFSGLQLALPLSNLVWDGNDFSFTMTLRFGEMGGTFDVTGSVAPDGTLTGNIGPEASAVLGVQTFTGQRLSE